MKKGLLIIFFTAIICFAGLCFNKEMARAENKTFQVVYNREIMAQCVDIEKFSLYRKAVEKHYLKKNARELDEDFTQYITPVCAPYGLYIKEFDKRTLRSYANSIKKYNLNLSGHLRVTVNREGKIEQKSRLYCEDYENFNLVDAEDEDCKRVLDIIDNVKLPKFDKELEYDYLTFDVNLINFRSGKKPPKVISSMPVWIGNKEIQDEDIKGAKRENLNPVNFNDFNNGSNVQKYYYDRLFYKQN